MRKAHRYNLGITGNCNYLAYIRSDSALQWMCWPMMDSSFIFGSLLDEEKGGTFKIVSEHPFITQQRYVENTPILVTKFICEDGEFEVVDFAPRFLHYNRCYNPLQFFRKIRRLKGQPRIKIICDPRGNYGDLTPSETPGSNHINYTGLHIPLRLTTNAGKTFIIERRSFLLT
jgi:GH15 family glucan-1,4-alpha-glucosidase